MSRRKVLTGLATVLGLGGVMAALRNGGYAPEPVIAEGTRREGDEYGDLSAQKGEWWLPPGAGSDPLPTVVLVHGGYWQPGYDLGLEDAVAADLASRGYLVWNIDYRSSAAPWPATLADVAAGYDRLAVGKHAALVDKQRLAVVGHSAGGQLALWLASRRNVPSGAVGSAPTSPTPTLCVAQAPVADLSRGYRERLGGGAVGQLLGGSPAEHPDRYRVADPVSLVPAVAPVVLIHGTRDDVVPVSQSESYLSAARAASGECRLETYAGGHFEHLDPKSEAVALLRKALEAM